MAIFLNQHTVRLIFEKSISDMLKSNINNGYSRYVVTSSQSTFNCADYALFFVGHHNMSFIVGGPYGR